MFSAITVQNVKKPGRDAMDDTAEQHIESAVFDKVKDTMLNNVPQG